jgi:phosphatidylserine decarboxylase
MARLLALFRGGRTTTQIWKRMQNSRVKKLVCFQWLPISISLALTLVAFQQFRRIKRRKESEKDPNNALKPLYIASDIEVSMYKMLPLRTLSRMWGWINSIELPVIMRSPILRSYVRAFGCNLNEAVIEDLKHYKNLGEFFRRPLKPGIRPIDSSNGVVSPADGTILYLGKAKKGKVEQVKGITYSLQSFLGPLTWDYFKKPQQDNEYHVSDYQKTLLINKDKIATQLYHCVIYLAPGDYHRFHSPAQWNINYRRHFPGKLLSVRPTFASWFPNLFNVNERVVYL